MICSDMIVNKNGGNFKLWFIKYSKPLKNNVIGEIVMNFDLSEYLYVYKVKYYQ